MKISKTNIYNHSKSTMSHWGSTIARASCRAMQDAVQSGIPQVDWGNFMHELMKLEVYFQKLEVYARYIYGII